MRTSRPRFLQHDIPPSQRPEIHITDMLSFCQCRWKWDWSSPLRQMLQPAILPEPFTTGQVVHHGLEYGYRGSVGGPAKYDRRAAVTAVRKWMAKRRQRVEAHTGSLWEHEKASLDKIEELSTNLVLHYGLWVASDILPLDRDFEVLGTEKRFRVPIPGTNLVYGGRMDGLVREVRTGKLYVLEFKTTRSLQRMSGVFRSIQAPAYAWAAGQVYDANISGILYRVLRKKIPDGPKVLQNGGLSVAKNIQSTYEWYSSALHVMYQEDGIRWRDLPSARTVLHRLRGETNQFFLQRTMHKSEVQKLHAVHVLQELGKVMANPRTPIFPVSGWHCDMCSFRDPCNLRILGHDYQPLIDAEYAPREYWEDVDDE